MKTPALPPMILFSKHYSRCVLLGQDEFPPMTWIKVSLVLPLNEGAEIRDRLLWISLNGREWWTHKFYPGRRHDFWFQNPSDAVYFKLRWYDASET